MTTTHDIVAKRWNLCNFLKDDGVTYHETLTGRPAPKWNRGLGSQNKTLSTSDYFSRRLAQGRRGLSNGLKSGNQPMVLVAQT